MSQQRHRRPLSPSDRRTCPGTLGTLLRLMIDERYQHTKLGAAFSPARQRRSSLFWQLAATYLGQPVLRVMLAGSSLRTGADCWVTGWSGREVGFCACSASFGMFLQLSSKHRLLLVSTLQRRMPCGCSSVSGSAPSGRNVWQSLLRGRNPWQQLHTPRPQQQSRSG